MTRPARIAFAAAVLVGLYALSARAQFSYKTGIDVAGFTVTVVNRAGETVEDLKADDFEVREDGVPQSVTYFTTGAGESAVPLHIGLLFDTSESMDRDLAFSRNAAIKFLKTFSKAVDFTLVEFSDDVRAARFAQAEFPRLVERIRSGKAKGRTSLYDAVTVYLSSAFDQTGRKVLVIFTDGDDTSSSRRWDETLRLLRASDVTIYPMGFLSNRGSGALAAAVEAHGNRAAHRRARGVSRLDERARPDVRGHRGGDPGAIRPRLCTHERRARRQVAQGGDQVETAGVGAAATADAGRVLRAGEVNQRFSVLGSEVLGAGFWVLGSGFSSSVRL